MLNSNSAMKYLLFYPLLFSVLFFGCIKAKLYMKKWDMSGTSEIRVRLNPGGMENIVKYSGKFFNELGARESISYKKSQKEIGF